MGMAGLVSKKLKKSQKPKKHVLFIFTEVLKRCKGSTRFCHPTIPIRNSVVAV